MAAPVLSVVLPTYNEAANIGPFLQALQEALAGEAVEFLVVDDDSQDGTAEAARQAAPDARVIVRTGERGLATAVVRGLREARGEYVAVMDADFQHPAEMALRLLDRARDKDAGLVVGSRYGDGGGEGGFGAVRRVISRGAATLSRVVLPPIRRHRLSDPMTGLFLVRRDRIDPDRLDPKGYKILLEILAKADVGRVEEIGYTFGDRRAGESKLGPAVIWSYLVHLVALGWQHPDNKRMAMFGFVGLTGVGVNLGLLYILHGRLGVHDLIAVPIAVETSILTNFFLNDRITFRDRHHVHFVQRMLKFNAVSLVALIVNTAAYAFLNRLLGIHYLVAEALAILVAFGVNYAGNLHWTYGDGDRFRLRQTMRRGAGGLAPYVPILLIAATAGGLFVYDIGNPDEVYFDEHYYVSVAYQIEDGKLEDPCWAPPYAGEDHHRPLNFEHPPLAKLMIYATVHWFGDGDEVRVFEGCRDRDTDSGEDKQQYQAFLSDLRTKVPAAAWRAPSILFGTLTVLFAGLAAARIFKDPGAGALAAGLTALDGVVFTSSRLAILDIFPTAFLMMALFAATFPGRNGVVATAVFLGLGFASKFTIVFAGIPVLLLLLWTNHRAGRLDRRLFDATVVAFTLIPLWILLASYAPWWALWVREMGFGGAVGHWWSILKAGIGWGTSVQSGHRYGMPSWQWFAMAKPTFYYQMTNAGGVAGVNRYVYAVGNPMLWWSAAAASVGIVATMVSRVIAAWRPAGGFGPAFAALGRPSQALLMGALLPVLTYAAFLGLSRETFLFYMTILVPLLAISLAGWMAWSWHRGGMVGRLAVPALLLLIVAAFQHYFPIVAARDVRVEEYERIMDAIPWMQK